jgi:hypothetical protein
MHGNVGLCHVSQTHHGEFDPGSEGTLAACITHASRTLYDTSVSYGVANG